MQYSHFIRCFHGMLIHKYISKLALKYRTQYNTKYWDRDKSKKIHFWGRKFDSRISKQ